MKFILFMGKEKREAPKHISTFPPHIIANIFSFLPVPDLKNVSCVSRRFKVIAYSDEVYEDKLRGLKSLKLLSTDDDEQLELKEALQAKLRQLPGGQFLPSPVKEDLPSPSIVKEDDQKISAALPDAKASHLIIGAGGLKQALSKQQPSPTKPKPKDPPKRSAREAFRKLYVQLYPYYVDFDGKTHDSRVFKDYQDLSEIGAVLSKLVLFDKCQFLGRDTTSISFGLRNAVEWFESTLLGQFDAAYDKQDVEVMKTNAYASFQLNGGLGCVHVFISKNPVFFDHTFNPSLLQSKLPLATGPSLGYALADEFAKFMDHLLSNCKVQAELISKVFVPDVDAITMFITRVFEDSISEYLNAVINASKAREGTAVYLHTLATSVYSCSQFVQFIIKNPYGIVVNPLQLKPLVSNLFAPYLDSFLEQEMEHLRKRSKLEIEKWDKRVCVLDVEKEEARRSWIFGWTGKSERP
jgi:recyclin-1